MIDTSAPPKKEFNLQEKSWDALCNIRSELTGANDYEIQGKLKNVI